MFHKSTERYLVPFIRKDLKKKMVFLSGPRQAGKTTLAMHLLQGNETHPAYFNWDHTDDQKKLLSFQFPAHEKLIVLDEIHKYSRWRNWLKGLYDKTKSKRQYLVTGSARLDLYSRGGDSLTGRYHMYRLHPLSLAEVDKNYKMTTTRALIRLGGFPEPFFSGSDVELKRWQKERRQQVLREDLRDLEKVNDLTLVALLADRLPELVGSPLSINALREDLQVAHGSINNWLQILERLFYVFRISPYGPPKIRAVKKEQKAYLWDWALVNENGCRFENMVACQLLKYCHFIEDTFGDDMELRYLRDTDGREVDFVVLKNKIPLFAVECKFKKSQIPQSLFYFAERSQIPKFYLVHMENDDHEHPNGRIRVLPFSTFVRELELP